MGTHLDRALILVEQSRHELAERELRQELAADPDNSMAHALLGLCLAQRKQFEEATHEAQLAVHHAPDLAFAHYASASILHDRNRLEEAKRAVKEAIRLDPQNAEQFVLLSGSCPILPVNKKAA